MHPALRKTKLPLLGDFDYKVTSSAGLIHNWELLPELMIFATDTEELTQI